MNSKRALKRGEEGENKVAKVLDSDASFHHLINNLVLLGNNDISHQIDHILINENGIFVIETKNYYGEINDKEEDSFWTRSYFEKGKRKTIKFHNPLKQNMSHIRSIVRLIGRDYPIYCFVVFPQNNVDVLDIFNVCNLDSLTKRLNLIKSDKPLSKEKIEKAYETLLMNEADINNEQHVNKVKEVEKERKEHQKKIRMAIEKRICPYCGWKLTLKGDKLVCYKCGKTVKL